MTNDIANNSIRDDMREFRGLLQNGAVQRAYGNLLSFIRGLRLHFKKNYPDLTVSSLYQGYMDMTYFALFPPLLKQYDLKIAIVFNYESFSFEAWLAGRNRETNRKYWEVFKQAQFDEYRVITPGKGIDSIVEGELASDFDLTDPEALTSRIESTAMKFIDDIEAFLGDKG